MLRLKVDIPLLLGLFLLSLASLLILYSAGGENMRIIVSQSLRMLVAFSVMMGVAQVRPDTLFRWSPLIFIVGLILLVLVLLIGHTGKGATRWLDLGFFRFQPSEIMKSLIYVVTVLFIPAVLIYEQPDLGTALMIMMSGTIIIFMAGFAWRNIIILTACGGVAAPLLWHFLLHDYQRRRILTVIDPWSDPLGDGYQSIQSMIAIGSGGGQGKGWLQGSQSQLEFIPERHTDFIFSVFSEEFGFIGVLMLLSLYLFITARGLYIAYYTKDTYSRLLAGSLSMTFFFYVFVNIGMVAGMLPVVGVPLPLISYGGTSMVTLMAGFGILMGIHGHRSLMSR